MYTYLWYKVCIPINRYDGKIIQNGVFKRFICMNIMVNLFKMFPVGIKMCNCIEISNLKIFDETMFNTC